jgi:hypothetical protein
VTLEVVHAYERFRLYGRSERALEQMDAPANELSVEWKGRAGHPSSYGLIGGHTSTDTTQLAPDLGAAIEKRSNTALTGDADVVHIGLPQACREAQYVVEFRFQANLWQPERVVQVAV